MIEDFLLPHTTQLHDVIKMYELPQVYDLIAQGYDLDVFAVEGGYPLEMSIELGHTDISIALLEAGANPNLGVEYSPLDAAAANGYIELVNLLIIKGADINHLGEGGHTPIMSAVMGGHPKIVKILTEHGADINAWSQGESVLCKAIVKGNSNTVQVLIDAGANTNIIDSDNNSALDLARIQKKIELMNYLT